MYVLSAQCTLSGRKLPTAAAAVTFALALRRSCLISVCHPLAALAQQHHLKQHSTTAAPAGHR
jgi:hypothetical protein